MAEGQLLSSESKKPLFKFLVTGLLKLTLLAGTWESPASAFRAAEAPGIRPCGWVLW